MRIGYIDPGFERIDKSRTHWTDRSAIALFYDVEQSMGRYFGGDLIWAGYLGPNILLDVDLIVIEKPTMYPGGHQRPNDLIDLAWAGGRIVGRFGRPTIEVLPAEWKHQLPKPVCHERMWDALTPTERELLPVGAIDRVHAASRKLGITGKMPAYAWRGVDVLDAISIGLVHMGRMQA
jgi:hypothetical protein